MSEHQLLQQQPVVCHLDGFYVSSQLHHCQQRWRSGVQQASKSIKSWLCASLLNVRLDALRQELIKSQA